MFVIFKDKNKAEIRIQFRKMNEQLYSRFLVENHSILKDITEKEIDDFNYHLKKYLLSIKEKP